MEADDLVVRRRHLRQPPLIIRGVAQQISGRNHIGFLRFDERRISSLLGIRREDDTPVLFDRLSQRQVRVGARARIAEHNIHDDRRGPGLREAVNQLRVERPIPGCIQRLAELLV